MRTRFTGDHAGRATVDFPGGGTNLTRVLALLLDAYSLLVLVTVILSWIQVSPDNPIRRVTDRVVEPVLVAIRKVLPTLGGLDFSPWVLLIGLRLLRRLLG